MKNQQCPKNDCMYLHELGDAEASFTKEEMHQGKHQEYEKRLHDALITSTTVSISNISNGKYTETNSNLRLNNNHNGSNVTGLIFTNSNSVGSKNGSSSGLISGQSAIITATVALTTSSAHKEAWPSLSLSPVLTNAKETTTITLGNIIQNSTKTRKERSKQEKTKNDKNIRTKQRNNSNSQQTSGNMNNNMTQGLKETERTTNTNRITCNIIEQQQEQNNNHNITTNGNGTPNNSNNNQNISSDNNKDFDKISQVNLCEYEIKENEKQASKSASNQHNEEQLYDDEDDKRSDSGKDLLSHFRNTINSTHNSIQIDQIDRKDLQEDEIRLVGASSINNIGENFNLAISNDSCAIQNKLNNKKNSKENLSTMDFCNLNNNRELHNGGVNSDQICYSSGSQDKQKQEFSGGRATTPKTYQSHIFNDVTNMVQTGNNNKAENSCNFTPPGDEAIKELHLEKSSVINSSCETNAANSVTLTTTTAATTTTTQTPTFPTTNSCFNPDIFNIGNQMCKIGYHL